MPNPDNTRHTSRDEHGNITTTSVVGGNAHVRDQVGLRIGPSMAEMVRHLADNSLAHDPDYDGELSEAAEKIRAERDRAERDRIRRGYPRSY